MTSPQGPHSSPGDSPDESSSPSEHAEQWAALTDLLDADGPQEVVSRVRALQQGMHTLDARLDETSGDDVGAAVREMREQLGRLREQNADLADRSGTDLDRSSGRELHPETEVLLGQLDAASLPEAQERIESLTAQVENLYREKEVLAEAGLMSSQEALDEINRLQRECDRLRSREPDADDASGSSPPDDAIADVLGISSRREARELDQAVRRLSSRLDNLLDEKETLASNLGVADADAVLDLVRSMEGQLSAFYEAHEEKGLNGHTVPPEIESILGVSTAEEARELVSYVRAMNDRLEQLSAEHERLASKGLDAQEAVAIIDSMEEQLVALYGAAEAPAGAPSANGTSSEGAAAPAVAKRPASSDSSIAEILGIEGTSEARELDRLVRNMSRELDRLRSETERLSTAGLTAETALRMIDSMEEQLVALYHAQDRSRKRPRADADRLEALAEVIGVDAPDEASPGETDPVAALVQETEALLDAGRTALADGDTASSVRDLLQELSSTLEGLRSERDMHAERAERLDALQEVLGISTLAEAHDLTSLVENLDAQLQTLYAEREALGEVGLSTVEDAIDMIRSMEHQLEELYQEQEALQDPPRPASPTQQDTFEQLQSLYKEQEKLRRALGVSEADDIIEMVEDLSAQLDATYGERDGDADDTSSPQAEEAASAATRITLDSMRHQLEVLYAEREALLKRGFESAEAAAARIDELRAQLQRLEEEHTAYQEHLSRLEEAVGTTDVSEIARRMEPAPSSDWDGDASLSFSASPPPGAADDDPFVDTAPALLPDEALAQLDAYAPGELDNLSVGVLQLDDQGIIQTLNERGRQFPGLDEPENDAEVVGRRLFERVPSTSNALFLGRFKKGVEQGAMDARFPYTFVTPGDRPTVFFVHLYRDEAHQTNWVLFRPA
jgi:photoactive yellow protein